MLMGKRLDFSIKVRVCVCECFRFAGDVWKGDGDDMRDKDDPCYSDNRFWNIINNYRALYMWIFIMKNNTRLFGSLSLSLMRGKFDGKTMNFAHKYNESTLRRNHIGFYSIEELKFNFKLILILIRL